MAQTLLRLSSKSTSAGERAPWCQREMLLVILFMYKMVARSCAGIALYREDSECTNRCSVREDPKKMEPFASRAGNTVRPRVVAIDPASTHPTVRDCFEMPVQEVYVTDYMVEQRRQAPFQLRSYADRPTNRDQVSLTSGNGIS